MLLQARSRLTIVFECCRVLAITRQVQVPCRGFVRQEQGKGEGNTAEANCLSTPKSTVGHRPAIACEGSSGRDWPWRNFFGAALCSAFSLERKARVGWWDASLLVRGTIQRALARFSISLFPTADHAQTFSSSSLTPSSTYTPLTPPYPSSHHHYTTYTRHNGPHQRQRRPRRDFPVRPTPP